MCDFDYYRGQVDGIAGDFGGGGLGVGLKVYGLKVFLDGFPPSCPWAVSACSSQ